MGEKKIREVGEGEGGQAVSCNVFGDVVGVQLGRNGDRGGGGGGGGGGGDRVSCKHDVLKWYVTYEVKGVGGGWGLSDGQAMERES